MGLEFFFKFLFYIFQFQCRVVPIPNLFSLSYLLFQYIPELHISERSWVYLMWANIQGKLLGCRQAITLNLFSADLVRFSPQNMPLMAQ